MATKSEDAIRSLKATNPNESDSEDEDGVSDYPDFSTSTSQISRLDPFDLPSHVDHVESYIGRLPATTAIRSNSSLPKRGLKDFEPHATQLQATALETSRQAMHDALVHTRIHNPKIRVTGIFDDSTGETLVRQRKGNWLSTVGKDVKGGGVVLRREEALWALERGSLDVRYQAHAHGDLGVGLQLLNRGDCKEDSLSDQPRSCKAECEVGLPMSLQAAYATLIDDRNNAPGGKLTSEEYVVYAGLKRAGLIVLRAPDFKQRNLVTTRLHGKECKRLPGEDPRAASTGLIDWFNSLLFSSTRLDDQVGGHAGPLVKPGLYRNFQEIYRLLDLTHARSCATPHAEAAHRPGLPDRSLTTTFHIYKPNPARPFKKREPGPPDFSVCVVAARTTRLPTMVELDGLLSEQRINEHPLRDDKSKRKRNMGQVYGDLKRGHRNVLLAIVDEGIVSYMNFADASFAQEGRLFDRESFGSMFPTGSGPKNSRNARPQNGKGNKRR